MRESINTSLVTWIMIIKPLRIILPNTRTYVKRYDVFFIEDDELLRRYNDI